MRCRHWDVALFGCRQLIFLWPFFIPMVGCNMLDLCTLSTPPHTGSKIIINSSVYQSKHFFWRIYFAVNWDGHEWPNSKSGLSKHVSSKQLYHFHDILASHVLLQSQVRVNAAKEHMYDPMNYIWLPSHNRSNNGDCVGGLAIHLFRNFIFRHAISYK